jgi:Skp family chaperone for outer membrane proteins
MKNGNFTRMWLAVFAAFIAFGATTHAIAQEAPAAKIIVIDLREVQRSSLAGKDLLRQVENYRSELEAERAKLEQEMRDTEQELDRQRPVLSQDALEEKYKAAQQKFQTARSNLQDKVNRFQMGAAKADRDLQSALTPIYTQLLTKYNANFVLDRSVIIQTSGNVVDVTREVVQALDKAVPTMKLEVPPPGSATPSNQ